MKIAIAVSGKDLNSPVDPRFGRCPYFLIVDSETQEFESIENKAGQAARGAGIAAAQLVTNKGVGAVIAGNFGPNALNVLSASGIKIFVGISGITAKEALTEYQAGKLKETTAATAVTFGPPASRQGMGMGRGMGRGRGGGWGRGRQ